MKIGFAPDQGGLPHKMHRRTVHTCTANGSYTDTISKLIRVPYTGLKMLLRQSINSLLKLTSYGVASEDQHYDPMIVIITETTE